MQREVAVTRVRARQPLRYEVLRASELSEADCTRWGAIQESNAAYASPYFTPEFTQAVAAVRDDVFVTVLRDEHQAVGFFPFQRAARRIGKPVGGIVSDYQGAIVADGVHWKAPELVRASGLAAWDFDHLIASQREFEPYCRAHTCSPIIDLSHGYDAYLNTCRRTHTAEIRKIRKLERERGPMSFVVASRDAANLETILQWKAAQYVRTGVANLFLEQWIPQLMRNLHRLETPRLAGLLSVLEVGGRPIAAHFGIRSKLAWHYWFPAYDPQFARYSPGLILLIQMAQHAESLGLRWIDLGKGGARYKDHLQSSAIPLAEGSVECSASLSMMRRLRGAAAGAVRHSPLVRPARYLRETIRRWRR